MSVTEAPSEPCWTFVAVPATEQQVVIGDVIDERMLQDQKWGSQRHLADTMWLAILAEEFGEAAKEVLEKRPQELYNELMQVAAVAVAWMEALAAGPLAHSDVLPVL